MKLSAIEGTIGITEGILLFKDALLAVLQCTVEHIGKVADKLVALDLVESRYGIGKILLLIGGLLIGSRQPGPSHIGIGGTRGSPSQIVVVPFLGQLVGSSLEIVDDEIPGLRTWRNTLVQGRCLTGSDIVVANDDILPVEQQHHVIIAAQETSLGNEGVTLVGSYLVLTHGPGLVDDLVTEADAGVHVRPISCEL